MLHVKSSTLKDYLELLSKQLTKTMLRGSSLTLRSTTNGIECLLKGDGFTLIHTTPDLAESDGQVTVDFNDLENIVQSIPMETFELIEVDGEVLTVSGLPLFKIAMPHLPGFKVDRESVRLNKEDTQAIIKEVIKHRRNLKQSIFNESTWVFLEVDKDEAQIRSISPLEVTVSKCPVDGFFPKTYAFLDRSRIKLLETVLRGGELTISKHYLANEDYRVILDDPADLNREIYFPDHYQIKEANAHVG